MDVIEKVGCGVAGARRDGMPAFGFLLARGGAVAWAQCVAG